MFGWTEGCVLDRTVGRWMFTLYSCLANVDGGLFSIRCD